MKRWVVPASLSLLLGTGACCFDATPDFGDAGTSGSSAGSRPTGTGSLGSGGAATAGGSSGAATAGTGNSSGGSASGGLGCFPDGALCQPGEVINGGCCAGSNCYPQNDGAYFICCSQDCTVSGGSSSTGTASTAGGAASSSSGSGTSSGGHVGGTSTGTTGGTSCNIGFSSPVSYPVQTWPNSVAAGDLNGDGTPDLVVASVGTTGVPINSVSVLLNDGAGAFASQVTYVVDLGPNGSNPSSVAIQDLNGDGFPDLAVTCSATNAVSILFNAGNGTFGNPTTYPVGDFPASIQIGDIDGDGLPDLAFANSGDGTVGVMFGRGDGGFGSQITYAAGGSGPFDPGYIRLANLTGGPLPDLAVSNTDSDNLAVLLNDGTGRFGSPATFPMTNAPFGLAAGALTEPGVLDLAVTFPGSTGLSVLTNDGNGGFIPQATNYAAASGASVAVTDLNGDGLEDIVAGNEDGTVCVLLNSGGGNFVFWGEFPDGSPPDNVTSIAVADFNGDGRPDLAVTNLTDGTVSVLLTTCQ
ncbi:MAG TPA: VCBS repeat-containing protein [Myxococcales bacterium]|nr:VCBS repeat-containing protein [Myxococcales bacterium]